MVYLTTFGIFFGKCRYITMPYMDPLAYIESSLSRAI